MNDSVGNPRWSIGLFVMFVLLVAAAVSMSGCGMMSFRIPSYRAVFEEDKAVAYDTWDAGRQLAEGKVAPEDVPEFGRQIQANAGQTMTVLGGAPSNPKVFKPEESEEKRKAATHVHEQWDRTKQGMFDVGLKASMGWMGTGLLATLIPALLVLLRKEKTIGALISGGERARERLGGEASDIIAEELEYATEAVHVDGHVRSKHRKIKDRARKRRRRKKSKQEDA